MTDDRVQQIIDDDTPIYVSQAAAGGGTPPVSGLKPSDIVDNEFLDTSIALGF